MSLVYSDGAAIEDEIVDLLEEATDLGSGAGIGAPRQASSWPARYHLAPERANLVRHLSFTGLDVLELGAGFGGLSRYLAESAASLTAVEGSERRLAGLRARLRDLHNWQAVHGQLEEVDLGRRFDVVCLVGVLEYAELYSRLPDDYPGDSFDHVLERAASWLSPDGVLLLAIENRIGIKYWTGAGEDHSGRLFEGLAGYSAGPSVRTFSRRELAERLQRRGLGSIRWHLPFPDYKLPTTVITCELVERDSRLAVDLASSGSFTIPGQPRAFLFPDYLALESVSRAGLLGDFSNSFLLLASRRADSPTLRTLSPLGPLAWHYSPSRRIAVNTVFEENPGGGLVVRKRRRDGLPLAPLRLGGEGGAFLWQPRPVDAVVPGEYVRHRLLRRLHFGDERGFSAELTSFLRHVCERFARADGLLRGEAVDALYRNATWLSPGDYRLFDLEWAAAEDFPASWFVLRNVLALSPDSSFLGQRAGFATLGELYHRQIAELGLFPALIGDCRRETSFHRALLEPIDSSRGEEFLLQVLAQPFANPFSPPRWPAEAIAPLRRVGELEADLAAATRRRDEEHALRTSLEAVLSEVASCATTSEVELTERSEEIAGLQVQVGRMYAELSALRDREADERARAEHLDAVLGATRRSTSWRVTRPLRAVGRLLCRLGIPRRPN